MNYPYTTKKRTESPRTPGSNLSLGVTAILLAVAVAAPPATAGQFYASDNPPDHPAPEGIDGIVALQSTYPASVWVGEKFSINAHARNELSVPVLLTVEIVPQTDVCGLLSYGPSVGGASVRQHEYLLDGNGTAEYLQGLGGEGLLNGDTASMSMSFETTAVGTCYIAVVASVTILGTSEMKVATENLPGIPINPLPKSADLGGFEIADSGGCASETVILPFEPPVEPIVVAAGEVDLAASLNWGESCADASNFATLRVLRQQGDGWDEENPVLADELSDVGSTKGVGAANLEVGTHKLLVQTFLWNHWLNWWCIVGLVGFIGDLAWAIFGPEPVTKLFVIAHLMVLGSTGIIAAAGCQTKILQTGSFEVTLDVRKSQIDHLGLESILPGLQQVIEELSQAPPL